MVKINCKNCGSSDKHEIFMNGVLGVFDNNKEIERLCNNCENKYISKIKNQAKEIKELREYKLKKLKDEAIRGVFDGIFSASTPPLAQNDVDNLLKTHWQCLQGNTSAREQLTTNKKFCKDRLPSSKADEVIDKLLGEQLEIYELEKQIIQYERLN